ncbi:MAG TPA: thymidine phosphorylase [Bacilli bacterium]|jgi:pyrimidine-nucleoside phosphorylase|nr:thymidine phosphorylase [Bacilli bacterium]HQO93747.1 thymidine phosphorylase [Bacilli bacterium]HQQ39306.1 thymidine phosphorylase [Bacilli bacterium]
MRAVDIIIKKKEGLALNEKEINFMINGYLSGEVADYQMSALLMAIVLKGTTHEEEVLLTKAMLESGDKIDLSKIDGICVDKHSTGGVGDTTTLVIAPILAALGLKVAKMSGRGLGHTGGTIDKLEAIPGFNTSLSEEHFFKEVNEIGLAVTGQTANIAPADKKIYALRDVTGTVEAVALIASSIMSKKLASGADVILLDVKVGEGAFMKTLKDAKKLARSMVDIGKSQGKKMVALLTDMEQPLGVAVGNSIEVIEAIETLKGKGPEDLKLLCFEICKEILLLTDKAKDEKEALALVEDSVRSGKALKKLELMISAQGGNKAVINDYSLFGKAKELIEVKAEKSGYIKAIDALKIGEASGILGAGRIKKEDSVDLVVGIDVLKKVGDYVTKGDLIARIYANDKGKKEALEIVKSSFEYSKEKVKPRKLILGKIE